MYIRQRYRIYPNKGQEQLLVNWLGQCRFVWNYMLTKNQKRYDQEKKFIFKHEMINMLPELKKEYKWLKEAPSQALQQKCQDLEKALKDSYGENSKGFPKYKKRNTDTSGMSLPQYCKINNGKLSIPKMKTGIKIIIDTPLKGSMNTCTIKKNKAGQWFASFVVELPDTFFPSPKTEINSIVGLDVGLKEFLVSSDGEVVRNPRFLKKKLHQLKKHQRSLSRKKKGSNNKNKQRLKVAKIHNKVSNQRQDFIKKTANSIAKNNDLICIESLNVSGMVKNHKLAQAISDVSWSMFFTEIKWQAQKVGSHVVVIDRFFASSKTCSSCGHKKEELSLSDRTYSCEPCGLIIDRDANAAINIKNEGFRLFVKNTVGTTEINACQT